MKERFAIRPLSRHVGAEIVGLDPRDVSDPELAQLVLDTYERYHLVLIRGHELTEAQQVELCQLVGVISARGGKGYAKAGRASALVSNRNGDVIFGDGELSFHSDLTFLEWPLKARSLHALVLPKEGGNTLFSNVHAAYEALPVELKARIDNLCARHAVTYERDGQLWVDEHTRPVVGHHSPSGKPVLMVSRAVTKDIPGMERPEFRALLKQLWAQIEREEFVYTHVWQMHDIVLWDNVMLQHARTTFDPEQPRTLRVVSVDSPEVAALEAAAQEQAAREKLAQQNVAPVVAS